jgi:twitching motility protein PilT
MTMLLNHSRRFGEFLVDRHVLSRDALEAALEEEAASGTTLPALLLEQGAVSGKDLVAATAQLAEVIESVYAWGEAAPKPAIVHQADPEAVLHLNDCLERVVELGGSDLHLTAGAHPMVRIHGEIEPLSEFPVLTGSGIREMVYAVLSQKQRETFESELELDTSHTIPGKGRFRVNVLLQRDSVGAVMRVIPFEIVPFDTLGMPAAVANFAELSRGLVLVTGPTGSGKSTTLASLIDIINRTKPVHIMTVEDPIEFLHSHKRAIVNQREVGEDTRSLTTALKHYHRQHPDVNLVGEIRDLETISTALTAAETGHLVFATLHTQDAPQSVDRVNDGLPTQQQTQIRVQLAT